MLSEVSYKKLSKICGEYELSKSGKKIELIKRLVENAPEEELRVKVIEFMGISKKLLEHETVPNHKILDKEKIEELTKKFGIKKWQFPKITDKDPIVILVGAKPGNVLEIVRDSETAGTSKYYRLVVRGD
jgi:DNA-directed RNA polymerase subunit H